MLKTRGAKLAWIWLLVLVALAGLFVEFVLPGLLPAKRQFSANGWGLLTALIVINLLTALGLVAWRLTPETRRVLAVVGGTDLAVLASFLFWKAGFFATAVAVSGVWLTGLCFYLGLMLIRLVLSPGFPILGVARTLVDEAIRMKIALIFIVGLVLILPILPLILSPAERLQYRIQNFLTYSLTICSLLLSLMTVFLACGTITGELQRKHIFLTMTKPVSRLEYLAGKWLGIALLNLLLLTVTFGVTFVFTQMLRQQPARDVVDYAAVEEQVLVARQAVGPLPPANADLQASFMQRFKQLYAENPQNYGDAALDLNDQDAVRRAIDALDKKQRDAISKSLIAKWHTIAPRDGQLYRFTGLAVAKKYGPVAQLRFKATSTPAPPDEKIRLAMKINGRPWPVSEGVQRQIEATSGTFHVIYLPLSELDADGAIELEVRNENIYAPEQTFPASIAFEPGDGLQVLYRVGGFTANLARSLAVLWVRLGFLAMLGLAAGTFLGFPVACLLSLMYYFCAAAKSFLVESLGFYAQLAPDTLSLWGKILFVIQNFFGTLAQGKVWDALKIPIRLFGESFVAVVPSFSEFDPTPLLADGRLVPTAMVTDALLWIGLVSAGFCAVVGYAIFRRRELARVTI